MKKLSIYFIVFILLSFFGMKTANAQVKNNVVKANLFGAVVGQFQLAYERALSEKFSAQLSAGIIRRDVDVTITSGNSSSTTTSAGTGFIIIPEVRYYFTEAPKGVYSAAFFRYRTVTNEVSRDDGTDIGETSRSAVGGGLLIGYQFLISDAVALDLQIGPQYKAVSSTVDLTDPNTTLVADGESDGIGVRFAFNLGFAF